MAWRRYEDYIKSEAWAARRAAYWRGHSRRCRVCRDFADHLHHKTYVRMGLEDDKDLVPLCAPCHMALHKAHKATKEDLSRFTSAWIAESKGIKKTKKEKSPKAKKKKGASRAKKARREEFKKDLSAAIRRLGMDSRP